KQAGLRLSIIARPSREEAVDFAYSMIAGHDRQSDADFVKNSDSKSIAGTYHLAESDWLTPWLWTGAVRVFGAPAMAIVGTPAQVASAIMEYRQAGITHFIFSGWPKLDSMKYFGQEVLPLVRAAERGEPAHRGLLFSEIPNPGVKPSEGSLSLREAEGRQ